MSQTRALSHRQTRSSIASTADVTVTEAARLWKQIGDSACQRAVRSTGTAEPVLQTTERGAYREGMYHGL